MVGSVSTSLVVVVLVVIWEMGWGSVGPSVSFVPIMLLVVVAMLVWMVLMSVVVVVLVGSVVVLAA